MNKNIKYGVIATFSLIVFQFIVHSIYRNAGWYSQWPFHWDENRYFDYLFFYSKHINMDGIIGFVYAYLERPAYSPTLLITSLPIYLLTSSVEAVYIHLILYIIVFDYSVYRLIFLLTSSKKWALVSLLIIHFFTSWIFGTPSYNTAPAALSYQVHALFAFFVLIIIYTFIEVLYKMPNQRNTGIWIFIFSSSICFGLLTRGSTAPLLGVICSLPVLILFLSFIWIDRRINILKYAIIFIIPILICCIHYAFVLHNIYGYIESVMGNNRWNIPRSSFIGKAFYYFNESSNNSFLFLPLMFSTMLFMWIRIPHVVFLIKRLKNHKWLDIRLLSIYIVFFWTLIILYMVPIVFNIKGKPAFIAFLLLGMVVGLVCFYGIFRMIIRGSNCLTKDIGYQLLLWSKRHAFFAICMICCAVLSRDVYGLKVISNVNYQPPKTVHIKKIACLRIVEFIETYVNHYDVNQVKVVTFGFASLPNIHTLSNGLYLRGKRQIQLCLCPPSSCIADIYFLPANKRSYVFLQKTLNQPGNPDIRGIEAIQDKLIANGYLKGTNLPITEGIQWRVYYRKEQINDKCRYLFP